MTSICNVMDKSFGVKYDMKTTTLKGPGGQMILDGSRRDLRHAGAGACNIVPTSPGTAKAATAVLPTYEGKLNGIAPQTPGQRGGSSAVLGARCSSSGCRPVCA